MKRLLTFIYGLFCFGIAVAFNYKYEHEISWFRYGHLIMCILMAWTAIEKFNKATK